MHLWLSEGRLETEEGITQELSGLGVCGRAEGTEERTTQELRAEGTEERTTQELHYQQAGRHPLSVSVCGRAEGTKERTTQELHYQQAERHPLSVSLVE